MNTNQIEKQLIEKCKSEIENIVTSFTNDIDKLQEKYGGNTFIQIKPLSTKTLTCMYISEFKKVLCNSIEKKLIDSMLKSKTKELLSKIDLLS